MRFYIHLSGSQPSLAPAVEFYVNITQGMPFDGCHDWVYLCIIVTPAVRSAWSETDTSNNFFCVDISSNKICEPGGYDYVTFYLGPV